MEITTPNIFSILRKQAATTLSPGRLTHVLGVEAISCHCAVKWGIDPRKALLAALLHDIMKQRPKAELRGFLDRGIIDVSHEDLEHPQLWHGVAAAVWAIDELGLEDMDIAQAVAWHTTGTPGMSDLGLVLFVSDFIEPSRNFRHVFEMRKRVLSRESVREAALDVARNKIAAIERQGKALHSRTLDMAEWLESLQHSPELLASRKE
ncbi:MAG: bis(5'-nucleosyl)-tetraphosphatase (symmetrical) YqeK [Candidatus Sumerlaeia bacterium]|nr:bis(5'-nucleosyl)-tetraphosphatase (symmetrical) YqeK [Candidatus Sumerlaeia bacterium]